MSEPFKLRTSTVKVIGSERAAAVAAAWVGDSEYLEVDPEPFDVFAFSVKVESLDRLLALRARIYAANPVQPGEGEERPEDAPLD